MTKILLCAPVHEKEHIFHEYLEGIRALEIPEGVQLDKCFIFHNCEHLAKMCNSDERFFFNNNKSTYKKDEVTHHWKDENFNDVVAMKNALLEIARRENYDYIFYVDSDLVLHEKTLTSLLEANKDMIANIFWTKWDNKTQEMPNCWHFDHYQILKSDLDKWRRAGYYQVGMTGACTLIKRDTFIIPTINWHKIYNMSYSVWEDRAFCSRVAVNNKEIWIDSHYPATHLYTQAKYYEYLRGKHNDDSGDSKLKK